MEVDLKKELEAIRKELKADLKREMQEFRKAVKREIKEALVDFVDAFAGSGRRKIAALLEKLKSL